MCCVFRVVCLYCILRVWNFRVIFFVLYFSCYIFLCYIFCFVLYKITFCYINWMCVILLYIVPTFSFFNFFFSTFSNFYLFIQTFRFSGVVFFVLYFLCCMRVVFLCCIFRVVWNCFSLTLPFLLFWKFLFLLSGYLCLRLSL